MVEENESQATTDDSKPEETLITAESQDQKPDEGPAPIYKDEPEESKENPEVESKEAKTEETKDDDTDSEEKPDDDSKDAEEKEVKPGDKDAVEYSTLEKPEDSMLSDADMERIVSEAKEQGLSKDAAQKMVELANETLDRQAETIIQRHDELSTQWIKECKEDKEIGGEKFEESVSHAHRAIKQFGTDKFIESLNETKYGNNPEVLRVFARIGRAMSDDNIVIPGNHPGAEKSLEDVFYGEQNNN